MNQAGCESTGTVGVKNAYHRLATRRSIDLLAIMIDTFYGNAHLSLEGDLRYFPFEQFQNIGTEPTAVLVRNTISPLQQFVVIPLETEAIPVIKRHVLNCVGIRKRVAHIQIEKNGHLMFFAYDQFDRDMVSVTSSLDISFLEALIDRHAIWSYQ